MKKPVVLIIRDGWGINPAGPTCAERDGNATLIAKTPYHETLYAKYPQSTLSGSGEDVGLPDGQMGNSEVGHLNLGAGRIVYQDLTRINKAIRDGEFASIPSLQKALAKAKSSRLHLFGLISDGGVHSHQDHLVAICQAAKEAGVTDIQIHAITDGRDTSPTGGADYMAKLEADLEGLPVKIVTVVGRYYAMDRDKRWERTKLSWDAIVHGVGEAKTCAPSAAIREAYNHCDNPSQQGDEFLKPMLFGCVNEQRVRDGDVVLCFNFRADRARQLSLAFLRKDFDGFDRGVQPQIEYLTMTEYDKTYGTPVIFEAQTMKNIFGEVVSAAGLTQVRAAETEKYPHVTFFFNGGVEVEYPGEKRVLAQSPKDVATYDLKPEMSAHQLTELVLKELPEADMVILNYANPDMVGHTGSLPAAVKAVETVDDCVRQIVEKTLALGGKLLITADHGNCELMKNPDGSPNTAHTTNLVHLLYVANDVAHVKLRSGILADVAPTLLDMLGVAKPAEMTGTSLVS